jgi:hypothetical protein
MAMNFQSVRMRQPVASVTMDGDFVLGRGIFNRICAPDFLRNNSN